VVSRADDAIDRLASQEAINAVEGYVGAVNGYLSEQAPWTLAKDDDQRARVGTILATAAEALRAIAVLYHPVMPRATRALWSSLGADQAIGRLADQRLDDSARWSQLPAGTPITKGAALFPRLVDDAPTET
jgi:methionyl-tRNA synthetase